MPADDSQLLPGTLYLLVLRTLANGPMHGYAIARRIREASANGLDIQDGSLYPALNRMTSARASFAGSPDCRPFWAFQYSNSGPLRSS